MGITDTTLEVPNLYQERIIKLNRPLAVQLFTVSLYNAVEKIKSKVLGPSEEYTFDLELKYKFNPEKLFFEETFSGKIFSNKFGIEYFTINGASSEPHEVPCVNEIKLAFTNVSWGRESCLEDFNKIYKNLEENCNPWIENKMKS